MAYNKTVWVNNEEPSIDADNLNKMEQGIFDAQYPDGGTSGQLLAKTVNGKAWVDAPNSAVWGLIQGTLSDQTDLQAALDDVGNVDTVNGIQPDTNKNVQVDVELTQAEYDALPSSKLTDDVNYYIKDGTNLPVSNVIPATGVQYDNSSSGLDATNVQAAIDENASSISELNTAMSINDDKLHYIGEDHRASVSVLEYAKSAPQGISFFQNSTGSPDNPTTSGSFGFIIMRMSTGRSVYGLHLGSYNIYLNRSADSGVTWTGWRSITFTV